MSNIVVRVSAYSVPRGARASTSKGVELSEAVEQVVFMRSCGRDPLAAAAAAADDDGAGNVH
jgi:hypothetical protein